jgi:hypothetical protein
VLEDAELEAWHPATLAAAYDSAPPMLKYIINQLMARLQRMESLMGKLSGFRRKRSWRSQKGPKGRPSASFTERASTCPATTAP